MSELTDKLPGSENAPSLGNLGFVAGLVLSAAALAFQGAILYAIASRKK